MSGDSWILQFAEKEALQRKTNRVTAVIMELQIGWPYQIGIHEMKQMKNNGRHGSLCFRVILD